MARSVKNNLVVIAVAVAAAVAGYLVADRPAQPPAEATPAVASMAPVAAVKVGDPRPDFTLPDLRGKSRSIAEWDGKVTVVNFWATWCPPCLKEIPLFMELQAAHGGAGLQFIGIAADVEDRVRQFVAERDVNYPILVGENAVISTAERYGNAYGTLPYSVVIDRDGRIRQLHRGEIDADWARENIISLLEK